MGEFWASSWVLIPLAGIFAGMFSQWLKFRDKATQLGASTDELESAVDELRRQNAAAAGRENALIQRVQNLEAIVTSETWDARHAPSLPDAAQPRIALPPEETDAARAARMADRLRA